MSASNGSAANGHVPNAADKAIETIRERAREQGRSVRDDEIRCIKTKGLSVWAKLLFWILSKICWESSPFLHDRRIGSVCITGRQLQNFFGFPQKRLYAQTKKTKDKAGAVVGTRRVCGAIEEMERAGLVWMSHKRIENIPSNKWPNVFNLCSLVPQHVQPGLGLLEGVVVSEETATNGGSSDFLAGNGRGSAQLPQNEPANNRRWSLAATDGGSSQAPLAGVGSNQRGELATTDGGSSAATDGGSSQAPTGGAANDRRGEQPSPAGRAPLRQSETVNTVVTVSAPKRLGNRAKAAKLPKRKDEEQFLELCRQVMSAAEVKRNAGLWITILRQDPAGAWKAMHDGLESRRSPAIARTLKTTWAKFVMDKYLSVFAAPEFRTRDYATR
jgi:hypothetical protein